MSIRAVPVTTPFTPKSITGCKLWLDAADPAGTGVMPANGASLTTWVDKSGIGKNLTGNGSPTLGTYNGLRVVNFSGSYFQNTSYTQSGPLTIIFIGQMNVGGWQTFSDNVSGLRPYVGVDGGTLRTAFRFGGTPTTNVEIWTLTFSSSDNTVFNVNGTDVRGAAVGYGGIGFTNGVRLGFAANDSAYLNGWIGEYFIYNTELGSTQYKQIEGYLAWKWGLQASLPAGHPYLAAAPTVVAAVNNKISALPFYTQFKPTSAGNCVLWLDATDPAGTGVQPENNSTLASWVDKSGLGNNVTQATTANQPTYVRGVVNGNPVVRFDGVSDSLQNSAFTALGTSNVSFWLVERNLSDSGAGAPFSFNSGPGSGIIFQNNGGLQPLTDGNNSVVYTSATARIDFFNRTNTGSGATGYINGSYVAAQDNYTGTYGTTFAVGVRLLSTLYTSGDICEILIFTGTPTSTQRQQVESYLAAKWGLTSALPTFTGPLAISGCRVWFDAYDASYTLSGTTVTGWTNKSGNANATTGSGTVSVNLATLAGKSSVRFPAGTNYLNVGSLTYSTVYRNLFFLVTVGTTGSKYVYLTVDDAICGQCYSLSSGDIELNKYGTVGLLTSPTGYFSSTAIVSICTSTGGNTGIWVNGVSQTLTNNNVGTGGFFSTGSTSPRLGGDGSTTGTLDMYELLQYDGSLTTTQRQNIEGYLAAKWGLQSSLPTTHPYYAASPNHPHFTAPAGRDPIVAAIVPSVPKSVSAYSPTTYPVVSTYIYTGANQTFTVPASTYPPIVTVYMWGAGGGGSSGSHPTNYGGAGAYVQGTLFVTPGETLTVIVGQGGVAITTNGAAAAATYGGGGGVPSGGNSTQNSSGGGRSAIQRSSTDIVTAGGGGGSGMTNTASNPGGYTLAGGAAAWTGTAAAGDYPSSSSYAGQGGTPSAGGVVGNKALADATAAAAGTLYAGGSAGQYGGGGGGGYYGGGGGTDDGGYGHGGGGGSSYTAFLTNATGSNSTNGYSAPNTASSYYQSGAGAGGTTGIGGNGLVVVSYGVMIPPVSSGGTVTLNGLYRVHTFTTVGTSTFTLSGPPSVQAQLLVVGGGGAGGGYNDGGGGGAGGLVYLSSVTLTAGTYSIVVGAGGTGTPAYAVGGNGGNSSAFGYTGLGGGGGGADTGIAGAAGGCGGGGGFGTAGGAATQAGGFAGGRGTYGAGGTGAAAGAGGSTTGAGGGGMGSAGTNLVGGSGLQYSISGTAQFYAAGGGAGTDSASVQPLGGSGIGGNGGYRLNTATNQPTAGAPNTGSGGGALSQTLGGYTSGAGGSGIVIISFLN
jgi:Glycine rich protein